MKSCRSLGELATRDRFEYVLAQLAVEHEQEQRIDTSEQLFYTKKYAFKSIRSVLTQR